jgi:hypothetical protein
MAADLVSSGGRIDLRRVATVAGNGLTTMPLLGI